MKRPLSPRTRLTCLPLLLAFFFISFSLPLSGHRDVLVRAGATPSARTSTQEKKEVAGDAFSSQTEADHDSEDVEEEERTIVSEGKKGWTEESFFLASFRDEEGKTEKGEDRDKKKKNSQSIEIVDLPLDVSFFDPVGMSTNEVLPPSEAKKHIEIVDLPLSLSSSSSPSRAASSSSTSSSSYSAYVSALKKKKILFSNENQPSSSSKSSSDNAQGEEDDQIENFLPGVKGSRAPREMFDYIVVGAGASGCPFARTMADAGRLKTPHTHARDRQTDTSFPSLSGFRPSLPHFRVPPARRRKSKTENIPLPFLSPRQKVVGGVQGKKTPPLRTMPRRLSTNPLSTFLSTHLPRSVYPPSYLST